MMMLFAEIPVYVTVKGVFRGIGLGHGCISMIAPLCLRTEHTLPNLATASRVSKPQALHPYSPFPGSFMPLQDIHLYCLCAIFLTYPFQPGQQNGSFHTSGVLLAGSRLLCSHTTTWPGFASFSLRSDSSTLDG